MSLLERLQHESVSFLGDCCWALATAWKPLTGSGRAAAAICAPHAPPKPPQRVPVRHLHHYRQVVDALLEVGTGLGACAV